MLNKTTNVFPLGAILAVQEIGFQPVSEGEYIILFILFKTKLRLQYFEHTLYCDVMLIKSG